MPPELQDMVVDYLHDDRASLVSCARVCKAWLPTVRFHLYTEVKLRRPEGGRQSRFVETLRAVPVTRWLCKSLKFSGRFLDARVAADIITLLPYLERLEWTYELHDLGYPGNVGIQRFVEAIFSRHCLQYLCSTGCDFFVREVMPDVLPIALGLRSLLTLKLFTETLTIHCGRDGTDRLNAGLCKAVAEAKKDRAHPQFRHLQDLQVIIGYNDVRDNLKDMGVIMPVVGRRLQALTVDWAYAGSYGTSKF